MINLKNLKNASNGWEKAKPFPHFVIDNFFDKNIALSLENDFPDFDNEVWHEYGNAIEVKKVCNNWNVFPTLTYKVFNFLNSEKFVKELSIFLFGSDLLIADPGLNGGGWHIHKQGGKLNTHLDYSLHPKLVLQRKINIIIYLNSCWEKNWGGNLGLWSNESSKFPGDLKKEIEPIFNRAVIFDTTCNSWHGLPNPINCPKQQLRKSLAIYYLCEPSENVDTRGKALFAPTEEQKSDKSILDLIKKRSSVNTASSVYKKNKD